MNEKDTNMKQMNKKKIIGIGLIVAVLLAGIILVVSRKSDISNAATPHSGLKRVVVTEAKKGLMQNKVPYVATVLADKSISLSTKLAGYVEKVYVEESQKVKKGDVLVSIDAIELNSSITALKATLTAQAHDLALAKSIYRRNVKLFKIGGLSKENLESSKVAFQSKSSNMENTKQKIVQLQHQSSYLTILAPFDGEIDRIFLHEGDLAVAAKPILSMSSGDKKLLFSYAASDDVIQKGQDVFAKGEKIGNIKSIYTVLKNGLLTAEVALTSKLALPDGSSINIQVLTAEKKGCILPSNTVIHKKEGIFLMTYREGKFHPLKVNVEMKNAQHILVSPCPKDPVARASEVKLAQLPAYENIEPIKPIEASNE
ncbi:MAG: efflux RND transporter periplasmic adaptor subunit [Sulfurovum sp.]|nr:efflux RND transporter periplasmic adaptor subunit [Sulfurovum sp.]